MKSVASKEATPLLVSDASSAEIVIVLAAAPILIPSPAAKVIECPLPLISPPPSTLMVEMKSVEIPTTPELTSKSLLLN